MNTISEELNRWNFDKITTSQWIIKIKEEIKSAIPNNSHESVFFYNSETTPDNIIGDFLDANAAIAPKEINTGYAIEFKSIISSHDALLKLISTGNNLVLINFNLSIFTSQIIIHFLKKIENVSIQVQLSFFNEISGKKDFPSQEVLNYLSSSPLNGSILTNFNKNNLNKYFDTINGFSFNLLNIDCTDLLLGEMLSLGVFLINQAFLNNKEFRHIEFSIRIENDFFSSIADIRVLRYLWLKILKLYQWEEPYPKFKINTYILNNNQQQIEYKDVLVATTKTMAAMMGGSDQIIIFDNEIKDTNSLSDALISIPLILKHESAFSSIYDPCYGAYYIESLSLQKAEQAWEVFSKIEKEGGYLKHINA